MAAITPSTETHSSNRSQEASESPTTQKVRNFISANSLTVDLDDLAVFSVHPNESLIVMLKSKNYGRLRFDVANGEEILNEFQSQIPNINEPHSKFVRIANMIALRACVTLVSTKISCPTLNPSDKDRLCIIAKGDQFSVTIPTGQTIEEAYDAAQKVLMQVADQPLDDTKDNS